MSGTDVGAEMSRWVIRALSAQLWRLGLGLEGWGVSRKGTSQGMEDIPDKKTASCCYEQDSLSRGEACPWLSIEHYSELEVSQILTTTLPNDLTVMWGKGRKSLMPFGQCCITLVLRKIWLKCNSKYNPKITEKMAYIKEGQEINHCKSI